MDKVKGLTKNIQHNTKRYFHDITATILIKDIFFTRYSMDAL